MTANIEKSGKGYNLFINGVLVGWVIGSRKNAVKELEIEKKKFLSR